jgi:hypothetical protein
VNDLVLLVGMPRRSTMAAEERREREAIAAAATEAGLDVEYSRFDWPCDEYVWSGDAYITQREHGLLGEGGYFLWNDRLLLVSTTLQGRLDMDHVRAAHPHRRVAWFPSGENPCLPHDERDEGHIDLSALLVDDLLVVDMNFYKERPGFSKWLDTFGRTYDLDVERYAPSEEQSVSLYPLNCRVLPEAVFVNALAPGLSSLLENRGIATLPVAASYLPRQNGSIRCCTNVYSKGMGALHTRDKNPLFGL